jgi:hypothetical protein
MAEDDDDEDVEVGYRDSTGCAFFAPTDTPRCHLQTPYVLVHLNRK